MSVADILPIRRLITPEHGPAPSRNLGLCSIFAHTAPRPVTPAARFLNLVSLVRFQPGAPQSTCTGRFPVVRARAQHFRIGETADILATRHCRRESRLLRATEQHAKAQDAGQRAEKNDDSISVAGCHGLRGHLPLVASEDVGSGRRDREHHWIPRYSTGSDATRSSARGWLLGQRCREPRWQSRSHCPAALRGTCNPVASAAKNQNSGAPRRSRHGRPRPAASAPWRQRSL